MQKINFKTKGFKLKKPLLFFIILRVIAFVFAFFIFPKFGRGGYGDALFMIGNTFANDYGEVALDPKFLENNIETTGSVLSIFSVNSIVNQKVLSTILPNSLPLATITLAFLISIIIWLNLGKILASRNSTLLWIAIFIPSFSVYTILPSKEATLISTSLIYICFEAKNIVFMPVKKWNSFIILIQRIIYIMICIILRGFASLPYLLLGIFISIFPFISVFLKKIKKNKHNIFLLITISFMITLFLVFIISSTNNSFFLKQTTFFQGSFLNQGGILSRDYLVGVNVYELSNFVLLPYLSLFPSINELLTSPKLIFYIIDSFLFLSIYIIAWNKIINSNLIHPRKIKFFQYLFVAITISYIFVYCVIGAYNLGSSQRFRQNFVTIGHIFPLIIFYNYKRKNKIPHISS